MPKTRVIFYSELGRCPVLEWLNELDRKNSKAYDKGINFIELLKNQGHELRRPATDLLRDGIHELRWKLGHVNYRLLDFFHGREAAILGHGLTKEGAVDDGDIDRAIARKKKFEANPKAHTHEEKVSNE